MTEVHERRYDPWHELANALTHGTGIALSIAALVTMLIYAAHYDDAYKTVSAVVFGVTMIMVYTSSTLYHSISFHSMRRFLRSLDHACIFLLIAGTYTPFTLVTLRGGWGWSLFGVAWGLALVGVIFKLFFIGKLEKLSLLVYVAMGWMGVVAIQPVVNALSPAGVAWLAAGGLMYTGGVLFYIWHSLPYHHAIWHLFVMAGTACHFITVYNFVLPAA